MGSRVYVGRLSYRAHERDIERFFRGYGRITEILLKNGYAFVEFSDRRDAEDAVHDLNGRSLLGDSVAILRVIVQNAKSRPRGRDMYRERLRERSRSRERRRSHNRRRSHSRDRKKRKHSSSDSDSLADNRRRSSSRSLSQSPRKSIKKAVSGKRRRHDRSSSSRSRSPEDRKYKDKRKEPKYRSSSETEGSVDRSEGNKHKIIVRGFDSRGKFAKTIVKVVKKLFECYGMASAVLSPENKIFGFRNLMRFAFISHYCHQHIIIIRMAHNSECCVPNISRSFRPHSFTPSVHSFVRSYVCFELCNHIQVFHVSVVYGVSFVHTPSSDYATLITWRFRLKHAAKKYGHLMDFKMRSDNSCCMY
ncbi:unnamed protein product [Thelazia callipaeda]|uniref:RRM domain-containing protein n=1 Tax=Thelazia callipaeda TaxID=103827 RepID=A0A0N5D4V3_THECL|nr:unnamed protein product [Thelazia callipaeda]